MFQLQIPQQAYNNTISNTLPSTILLHADKSWHQNLLISLLEQHTILGSPVPRLVKSLVQTSIPFLHKTFVQQHSQTKLKKSWAHDYEYPLAIG
jgi:hypothetical protein